ncbi:hypothetical protein NVS89_22620 [Ancylobacter sp. MQZ15Z-1]|uniref:Uncharacterized protein n=1 Tax=Ancylobacter mangrovi TaxID=2972472 RepID=A0A9X2T7X6_9HYPH|nr:hypothetical protein [Ancylobacter mangrovi]MCS0497889.1 hypothetical protein [Ancylobacter mangrovi]
MARIYVRTADPLADRLQAAQQRLRVARNEKRAEYARLRRYHRPRASIARQLEEITTALLRAELKAMPMRRDRPVPVADLFDA